MLLKGISRDNIIKLSGRGGGQKYLKALIDCFVVGEGGQKN